MDSSNIKKCAVCGQSFDVRRNTGCPNCSQVVVSAGNDSVQQPDNDVTVIQKATFTSPIDETISMQVSKQEDPNDVTIGISLSESGNKRGEITGWLVCVSGPDFGKDFRLRYNNNYIGRDMDMDVCISSDSTVHKQKHMTVVFEPNEQKFFCGPVGGAICYLNSENLSKTTELHDFDIIKLGSTELIFRSLCGEGYKW
jgi:hypothetical protein